MWTIDLSGKTALITGGTRNIGRAIAQYLAEAGADLALLYRSNDAAAILTQEEIVGSTSRRVKIYRVDVGDEIALEPSVEKALRDFGGVFSIVIHNAGHGDGGATMPNISTDQWRGTIAVNLDAAFFLTRVLLRHEGALPPGSSVVFIGSGKGHSAAAGLATYGTAKAGLVHFAAMLAQDIGPRGIRVNVVSPGFTDTGNPTPSEEEKKVIAANTALHRCGTPNDIAGAVLYRRFLFKCPRRSIKQSSQTVTSCWLAPASPYSLWTLW